MSAGPEEVANTFSASFYLAGVNIDASLIKEFPSLGVVSDEDESVKEKWQERTAKIAQVLQAKRGHTSWGNWRGCRGIHGTRSGSLEISPGCLSSGRLKTKKFGPRSSY